MTPKNTGSVGLRLTLGGAPDVWHVLPDVPGLYHPRIPTLARVIGMSDDDARTIAKNESVPLEEVLVPDDESNEAEVALRVAIGESVTAAKHAARSAHPVEAIRIDDELAASAALHPDAPKEG